LAHFLLKFQPEKAPSLGKFLKLLLCSRAEQQKNTANMSLEAKNL